MPTPPKLREKYEICRACGSQISVPQNVPTFFGRGTRVGSHIKHHRASRAQVWTPTDAMIGILTVQQRRRSHPPKLTKSQKKAIRAAELVAKELAKSSILVTALTFE